MSLIRQMRLPAVWLVGVCVTLASMFWAAPGHAQRHDDDRWELLGEQTVGFRVDTDSIVLRHNEEWYRGRAYRSLQFRAERNDVHLISLRIVYLNGHVEDLRVDRQIQRNSSLIVDLPGERSYLRQIDLRYRGNVGVSFGPGGVHLQQAVVKVYGDRARRGPPEIARTRWEELDTRRFNRTEELVVMRPARGTGRIERIKLRSLGDPIEIRRVTVHFANGAPLNFVVNRRLENGAETDEIDLGERPRRVERISVALDPRRRPGAVTLVMLGSREAGERRDARNAGHEQRGWVLLGEQSVGFAVDRDVININQSEDWYRTRRFRSLHIVAEQNDIHLLGIRLVYMNGYGEDLPVDQRVRAGGSAEISLREARSFIRQVELTYQSRRGFGGRAAVKVYGEPSR